MKSDFTFVLFCYWLGSMLGKYLLLSFLVWLFCIAFSFEFTWLLPLGIWASIIIFRMFTKGK